MDGQVDAEQAGLPLTPLASTVVLATITGYVDAYAYQYLFATFPANQSGNVALLGIAIGQGEWGSALTCIVAVLGFALGVAAGVALGNRARQPTYLRTRVVLLIELLVLAGVAVAVGVLGEGHEVMSGPAAVLLLAPAAFAMGIQTPVIVRTHGIPTPTTYMTGSVAHMAESFAEAGAGFPSTARRKAVQRGALLAVVLAGYVAGAAVGTTVGSAWNLALLVPVVALALLLVLRRVRA